MKSNLGRTERIVRIVVGLVFLALGAGWWWGFYVLGGIAFLTALIAWCPLWAVMAISTCKELEEEDIPVDSVSTDKDRLIRERRFK